MTVFLQDSETILSFALLFHHNTCTGEECTADGTSAGGYDGTGAFGSDGASAGGADGTGAGGYDGAGAGRYGSLYVLLWSVCHSVI